MTPLGILVGLVFGAPLGMIVLALCMAARRGDRQLQVDLTGAKPRRRT